MRKLEEWCLVSGELLEPPDWLKLRVSSTAADTINPKSKQLGDKVHLYCLPQCLDFPSAFKHSSGLQVIFSGVLHNRTELISGYSSLNSNSTNAEIVAKGYELLGETIFTNLIGSYTCIIYIAQQDTILCFADRLGDSRLYYGEIGNSIVISSNPRIILAMPDFENEINDISIVNYFVNHTSYTSDTYFTNIKTIVPGDYLKVSGTSILNKSYWRFELNDKYRACNQNDVINEFRQCLSVAVNRRINQASKIAILMSGGLDSTSLTALASEQAKSEFEILAASLVFDKYTSCDERQYIRCMRNKFMIKTIEVNGDDHLPLSGDLNQLHQHPNMIWISPLTSQRRIVLSRLRNQGAQQLLTGEYGDHLFAGSLYWLRDLLRDKFSINTLLFAMTHQIKRNSSPYHKDAVLRRVLPFNGITAGRFRKNINYLTSYSNSLLKRKRSDSQLDSNIRYERDRFEVCLNQRSSQLVSVLREEAENYDLNLMFPYRDIELVQLTLNLPAYYFYDFQSDYNKYILRQSMVDILPDEIRLRRDKTNFNAIFRNALLNVQNHIVKEVLLDQGRVWPKYVEEKYLLSRLNQSNPNDFDLNLFWNCICLELWHRKYNA